MDLRGSRLVICGVDSSGPNWRAVVNILMNLEQLSF
jgi:hypothetical protein